VLLQPMPKPRFSKRQRWAWTLSVGGGLFAVLMFALSLILLLNSDLIMPGVRMLDVAIGGRSRARAADLLQQDWQQRTVALYANGPVPSVPLLALGVTLDDEAVVHSAYERGRSPDRIGALLKGKGRIDVPPIVQVDTALAEANLIALAPRFYVSPTDARLRVADRRVEAIQAVAGRTLDVGATVVWLERNALHAVLEGGFRPVFAPVQPEIPDLSDIVAQANAWLSSPFFIHAYDPISDETVDWAIEPTVWGTWLSLRVDPEDARQLALQVDAGGSRAFLATQVETLGGDRYLDLDSAIHAIEEAIAVRGPYARVRVYHRERRHVVQFGETMASIARDYGMPYPWVQQKNPGLGDALQPGQALTIPSPDVLLPLPIVENKRIVISISQQRMWAFEGGAVRWVWTISTGIPSSPTSPGVFQIQSHEPNAYAASWDLWMPHFMGIYRPVPTSNFMNGFHGFPTRDGSNLLWTGNLGYPVTYGCILVSTGNAAALYEWAQEGVIVEIQP
jgi:lipoprotein-anchoring transpeptidase ErfK/SrfK